MTGFWKIFFITFSSVFLAELGDKTQLAVCFLSAKTKSSLGVWGGAVAAFIVSTFLAVILGKFILGALPLKYIKFLAGSVFIVLGLFILLGKL